jgi:hypothetical protein
VFTSDHGDLLGAHGGFNKQQPYDESIRVPLLFRWPTGLGSRGRELGAVINSEDIMPTLLGLCRIPIPKSVQGIDFSGYMRGRKDPSDGAALILCVLSVSGTPTGGREYRGIHAALHTSAICQAVAPVRQPDGPAPAAKLVGDSEHAQLQAKPVHSETKA